ncbi:MAG: flagellar basal body rod protein FlgC [Candidatus Methylomirabilis sp.]|nr:flagellar basal body rod protein FlgC [Deltaproteobacteria bacterium]
MMRAIEIASSGLSAQRRRMDAIASNLTNMNTTRTPSGEPYRRRDVVMRSTEADGGSFASVFQGEMERSARGVEVADVRESRAPFPKVYRPNHPDADEAGYVRLPNVNMLEELGDLALTQRSYEAGLQVITAAKTLLQKTLDALR